MSFENSTLINQASYDLSAEMYAQNVVDLHPKTQSERFQKLLPSSAKVLDIGCGSGRDAKVFCEMGLKVFGIDISSKMIEIATEQAPHATFSIMDIENLTFTSESFDGVWANCSLLHIPKKNVASVLAQIHRILKKNGILYLSVKQGDGETIEQDQRYGGIEKFWSFFQADEIKSILLTTGFTIQETTLEEITSSYHTHPQIKIFAKKSPPII